jgi:hypothetical protein
MARLFIGHKPGVGGVVKVMRYDTDEPLSTPNEDFGKFLFNSETSKLAYVKHIDTYKWDPSLGSGVHYFPSGSSAGTALRRVDRQGGPNTYFQYVFAIPGRIIGRGDVPIVMEQRQKKPLGVERYGPQTYYFRTSESDQYTAGINYTRASYHVRLQKRFGQGSPVVEYPGPIVSYISEIGDDGAIDTWFASNRTSAETITSIFDLPADSRPMPSAPAGTSGSRNTLVTPTVVRIAKAGASAEAGGDSIIADSQSIPLKVVRTGEVNIPSGQYVDVASPWPLTENSYLDYIAWRDGQPCRWPEPVAGASWVGDVAIRITYAVYVDKVRIYNRGNVTATVRFLVCTDDGPTTTGGSRVMRRLDDDNIQIKRPGSSDLAPVDGDILLDTRFSYLPIVAEGYVHRDEFTVGTTNPTLGDRSYTVNFPNDGSFVPYVKFFNTTEGGSIVQGTVRTMRTRTGSQWEGFGSSANAVAEINNTSVKFWLATSFPDYLTADWNQFGGYRANYIPSSRPIGIRYYIFALPVSF